MSAGTRVSEVAGCLVHPVDHPGIHPRNGNGRKRLVDRILPHILQHHVHNEFVGLLQVVQR